MSSPGRDAFFSGLGVSGSELSSSFGDLNGATLDDPLAGLDRGLPSSRISSTVSSFGDGNGLGLSLAFPDLSRNVRLKPCRLPSEIRSRRPLSGSE